MTNEDINPVTPIDTTDSTYNQPISESSPEIGVIPESVDCAPLEETPKQSEQSEQPEQQYTEDINNDDNELDNNNFEFDVSLWYLSLSKYCEQFNIYHCHPSEFLSFYHYPKNTITLLTFDNYEQSYQTYVQVNRMINNYKKHILQLNNQINEINKQYKQQLSNVIGFVV